MLKLYRKLKNNIRIINAGYICGFQYLKEEDKVRTIKMGSQLLGVMLYDGRINFELTLLTSAVVCLNSQ